MVVESIRFNTAAFGIVRNLTQTDNALQKNIVRVSSGVRINQAGDDPAGLSLGTKLESQFRGLNQAAINAQEGYNIADTARNAIDKMIEHVQSIREKASSAAQSADPNSRLLLQAEIDETRQLLDSIVKNTTFGKQSLLDGSFTTTVEIKAGNQQSGVSVASGPTSSTLNTGSATLTYEQVQEGSEQIKTGKDKIYNTGVGLSTDIAVSVAQFESAENIESDLLGMFVNRVELDR